MNATTTAAAAPTAAAQRPSTRNMHSTSAAAPAAGSTTLWSFSRTSGSGGSGGIGGPPRSLLRGHHDLDGHVVVDHALAVGHAPLRPVDLELGDQVQHPVLLGHRRREGHRLALAQHREVTGDGVELVGLLHL